MGSWFSSHNYSNWMDNPISRKSESIAPTTQRYQPISPPPQEVHSEGVKQFCAMCGASVENEATFCANCGVKIAN